MFTGLSSMTRILLTLYRLSRCFEPRASVRS